MPMSREEMIFGRALAVGLFACALLTAQSAAVEPNVGISSLLSSLKLDAASLSAGRALLQAEGEVVEDFEPTEVQKCLWDPEQKECGLNPLVALDLIAQAPSSPIKDFLLDIVTCAFSTTEEDCADVPADCKWVNGTCGVEAEFLAEISGSDSIGDCVGREVGVFLNIEEKFARCATLFNSSEACNIDPDCGWGKAGDQEICAFDLWKFLTGVPSTFGEFPLPRGLKKIMRNRLDILEKAIEEAKIETAEDVLNFPAPSFTCPDGVDYVVCNIAEEADSLLLAQIYCSKRHKQDGVCGDEDKLCGDLIVVENGTECTPAREVFLAVRVAQREKYLEAISDPIAAAIMRKSLSCLESDEKQCKEDTCVWESNACSLSPATLVAELAGQPVERGGIQCQVIQGVFRTGCMALSTQEACEGKDDCAWSEDDAFCSAGPLAYMNILFSNDQDLQLEAAEGAFECAQLKTEETCSAA